MKIAALILAGGQGNRMGGEDKGLIDFHGKPFIEHIINRLQSQVSHIAISANRNIEAYSYYSSHVFSDSRHWFQLGPLSALATAANDWELASHDWLLIVPCDTPLLPEDLVHTFMFAARKSPLCSAFYAQTSVRQHYSILFIKPGILPSVTSYLNGGARNIRGWLQQQRAREVMFADEAAFANYNTIEEMESYHVRF